ncbi:GNAT family N-acetyltransferase [Collimonas arenae]|uniref:GNAT family N-acetyltransferase n=1 Tax=Collimonas arenae TaxID=279058 RepID=UPI000570F461|nr:GNAT family N-acetyltransferase [Collimonas arenae]
MSANQTLIRVVTSADLERCYEIESVSYEGDEAATKEKIATRIATWPQGFIVLEVGGVVAGFINGGSAFEVEMSNEEFKELIGHDPDGPHVVIMSVVVHPDFQGRGIARQLMNDFIARMRALHKSSIHLMCKDRHISLYESLGFIYIKASESDHGGMAWHEMAMQLQ